MPSPSVSASAGQYRKVVEASSICHKRNEKKRTRSQACLSPVAHAATIAFGDSAVLSLSQAAEVNAQNAAVIAGRKRYKPDTEKRNEITMRKYVAVNGTRNVSNDGIDKFLSAVLTVEEHKYVNLASLPLNTRVMSYESFSDNNVGVALRLFRVFKNNDDEADGPLRTIIAKHLTHAKTFMKASARTLAVDLEVSRLLIRCLPQGWDRFLETAYIIATLLRSTKRIMSLRDFTFGDFFSLEDRTTTDPVLRLRPEQHLVAIHANVGSEKGCAPSEVFMLRQDGCLHEIEGWMEETAYLNRLLVQRLGIPMIDADGVTFIDRLKEPEWAWARNIRVYRGDIAFLYKKYREVLETNSDCPRGIKLRPHGARVAAIEKTMHAVDSGELGPSNILAFEQHAGHSLGSTTVSGGGGGVVGLVVGLWLGVDETDDCIFSLFRPCCLPLATPYVCSLASGTLASGMA